MAWIESHQELGHHPKLKKLCRVLDISEPQAVGHLHYLWWWSLDYCDDGDLSRFDPLDIAIGAMWDGDPGAFVAALAACGWVDQDDDTTTVHDWDQYIGKLLDQRQANRDRQRRHRDSKRTVSGSNGNVTVTSPSANSATVPNLTVPNQTKPPETVVSVAPRTRKVTTAEGFDTFWAIYPRTNGTKANALTAWKSIGPDGSLQAEIVAGVERWIASDHWREGYVKYAERFLRDRMWEDVPAPKARAPNGRHAETHMDRARAFADKARQLEAEGR